MWSDQWITELDPVEKLLFLYLLTNERTNIAGVYELPLKIMAVETGIEKDMIERILRRFEKDKRVIYKHGWVSVKNFIKHQDTNNPKIKTGIESALNCVPEELRDSLCIGYVYPSNNLNSNSNNNSNSSNEVAGKNRTRERGVVSLPLKELFDSKIQSPDPAERQKFLDYWTEKNAGGKKERWQMEKVFDVSRRWGTWMRNKKDFSKGKDIDRIAPTGNPSTWSERELRRMVQS